MTAQRVALPEHETQARDRALAVLTEVAALASMTPDVDKVLQQALALALEVVGVDAGAISVLDEATQELVFRAQQGWRVHDFVARAMRVPANHGLSGLAVQTGQPVVTGDVSHDPRVVVPEFRDEGVQAMALVPMRARGCVLGVLGVMNYTPYDFTPQQIAVLSAIADQIGIALTNARLYGEMRRRLDELTMLHEVSLAAASTLSLEEIADRVAGVVKQRLGFEHMGLMLLDERRGILRSVGHCAGAERELKAGLGLEGWVAERGVALRLGDVTQDSRYVERFPGVQSLLIVPLAVGERVIGVIEAASPRSYAFSADDERLMSTVARQLAITIENARLYQETERRLKEVWALYQLAQQMNMTLNIQERLDSIVWSLKDALGCRTCSIALLDPVRNVLEIRAAAGIKECWLRAFRLRPGEGVAGQVVLTGTPIYVPDTRAVDDFIFFDPSVRSLLTVPLSVQQRVIGTLTVDSDEPNAFSEADERLLTITAAQAAIAIENARLYVSLEQRAKNLAEVCAELREADRLKDELVQNISHELRTPLTFVKGYVELLLAGDAGPLTEEQKAQLQVVAEKTNAVIRLVSDIIFLQQIDQIPGKQTAVSLVRLARRAMQEYAEIAEKAGLTLVDNVPEALPPVIGDESRLMRVFDNLLNNAIKFSPDGGQIVVTIEDTGTMERVSIADKGIGIPASQQERIFERFYQVDGSARRRFGGVGLGLAIVKRIVETHGGKVWVESEAGEGSTFYFTIPKYQEELP